ncbi:MAG: aminotransferase class I/II-fold pyridoxal phosphate-dependent enzyme [Helicobacteraceae bacterium]|nr:aminotransferase class I/II-fold pyridoxal phosphate-dependent enzyme [Helicobacteraceae bacterium]
MKNFEDYSTQLTQSVGSKDGLVSPAIANSASFAYGSAQIAEDIFAARAKRPLYSRMGNPTSARLESIMAELDGGVGAVATSSGMGAIAMVCMSLLKSGDEIISIGGLFGGTYSFFSETLSRFGVKTHFFDVDELENISSAINENTKIVFLESVGNPNMRLPDIEAIANITTKHQVALVVDNTITPMGVLPLQLGADIVLYSTTKIISGNSSALGGIAVFRAIEDEDKFKTTRYAELEKIINKMGKMALVANAKKRALRDFGMSASAHSSYQAMLGLETLPLRSERINSSVEFIVKALNEKGLNVNHPSLPTNVHHDRYNTNFTQGCGTLFTIDFGSKQSAYSFLDNSKLLTITANIGDSRTLGLHMASTIYSDFNSEQKEFLGITEGLVRISVGLENPQDLINDILTASKE